MRGIIFAPITGPLVIYLRAQLLASAETYTSDVLVRSQLPSSSSYQKRMVVVRDDGGTDRGPISDRAISVNVWAEDSPTADLLCRYSIALFKKLPDGAPIVGVQTFSGPFEVISQTTGKIDVNGVTLSQYFFTFDALQRGENI